MSNSKIIWKTEKRKVSELKDYPKNPRKFTEKGVKDLEKSIENIGFIDLIAINADNTILGGHARKKVLKKLGIKEIECRIPDRQLTDKECEEIVVRLNKNIAGEWDFDILANAFEMDELIDWGFEEHEFGIEPEDIEGLTDEDEVPAEPITPITVLGDLWILGEHRLLCGDSTSIDSVEKLMAGEKADMVFTDPPYGMSYRGGRAAGDHSLDKKTGGVKIKSHGMIKNDDLQGDDLIRLVKNAMQCAIIVSKKDCATYTCFTWRTYSEFEKSLLSIGLKTKACIVWNKKSIGLGNSDYRPQHEFIFYSGGQWFGDKSQSDVWELSRGATGEYVHPTQKPVELIEKAVNNSSKQEDIIIDCFGGSGSTLIACEKINRKARLMELDEKYCDVIINRWQNFTGKKAVHAETGKKFGA